MTTKLSQVQFKKEVKDIFFEGNLVTDGDEVFLVTVPAMGYTESDAGTFWAIKLTDESKFISGGNYCKDLFSQFIGEITLEGKY